jgi:hypothetical protein
MNRETFVWFVSYCMMAIIWLITMIKYHKLRMMYLKLKIGIKE